MMGGNEDKTFWCEYGKAFEGRFVSAYPVLNLSDGKSDKLLWLYNNPELANNRTADDLVVGVGDGILDVWKIGKMEDRQYGDIKYEKTPFWTINRVRTEAARMRRDVSGFGKLEAAFQKLGLPLPGDDATPGESSLASENYVALNVNDFYRYELKRLGRYGPQQGKRDLEILFVVSWSSDRYVPPVNKVFECRFSEVSELIRNEPLIHFYQDRPIRNLEGVDVDGVGYNELARRILVGDGKNKTCSYYVDLRKIMFSATFDPSLVAGTRK